MSSTDKVCRLLQAANTDWPDNHRLFIMREIVIAMVAASLTLRKDLRVVGEYVVEGSASFLNQSREAMIELIRT